MLVRLAENTVSPGSDWPAAPVHTHLERQCEQGQCVQSREADLGGNVGFQQGLVKDISVRVSIACVGHNMALVSAIQTERRLVGWESHSQLLITHRRSPLRALSPCLHFVHEEED